MSLQDEGRALVAKGSVAEGMALIDEAMVAAVSGELESLTAGRAYCNMMTVCEQIADYRRAREWVEVTKAWCRPHQHAIFPGLCRIHASTLMRLRGSWHEAEETAAKAGRDLGEHYPAKAGHAFYEIGEIRLRMGDFRAAENAFATARSMGRDPLPGLAELRLRQGDLESASSLIDRGLAETERTELDRGRLLPCRIRIRVALGQLEAAQADCGQLQTVAEIYGSPALSAAAAQMRAMVGAEQGHVPQAIDEARKALMLWMSMDAPYEVAQVRALLSKLYVSSNSHEDAQAELSSAIQSLESLGAHEEALSLRQFGLRQTSDAE